MRAELIPRPVASNPDLLKILASTALATVGQDSPIALCRVTWHYTSGLTFYPCYSHAEGVGSCFQTFINLDVSVFISEGAMQGAKLSFARGSSPMLLGEDCGHELCGCCFLHSK